MVNQPSPDEKVHDAFDALLTSMAERDPTSAYTIRAMDAIFKAIHSPQSHGSDETPAR